MPYMQRMRLTRESNLDDNTTFRYKLPSVGVVTAIEMRINCNREATRTLHAEVHPLESCISKVELLKGGAEVVKSLTGQQLDAMNFWDLKRPNARRYRQLDGSGNDVVLFLLGGRGFYDKEYGFDFARMGETYLEYTYDLNEGDADWFEADDHDISLYGWRWMGPGVPTFKGYFRDRQLAAWNTSASGAIKTVAIPVGRQIRRVCVQAKSRAKTLGGTFSELELQVNKGEYSPLIIKSAMDHVMAGVSEYGLHNVVGGIDYAVDTQQNEIPRWWSYFDALVSATYGSYTAEVATHLGITLPARIVCQTTGDKEVVFVYHGYGFQKCLRIGFDHERDLSDVLDSSGLGALDLICTEAAASVDAAVFYQDIVPY